MYRNCRKCHCMNNSYNDNSCENDNNMMETSCQDVMSYEQYEDGCSCGFDEEYNLFPEK